MTRSADIAIDDQERAILEKLPAATLAKVGDIKNVFGKTARVISHTPRRTPTQMEISSTDAPCTQELLPRGDVPSTKTRDKSNGNGAATEKDDEIILRAWDEATELPPQQETKIDGGEAWKQKLIDERFTFSDQEMAEAERTEARETEQRPEPRSPVLTRVSAIQREEVSWLGDGRIPRRKITLIDGDPGEGKSFVTQAISAAVTRGFCFPSDERKEPGNVILMSAEDGPEDTIRPRLEDMEANLDRVTLLSGLVDANGSEQFLTLADLDVIEKAIAKESPILLVVDPIIAYTASKDTHVAAQVPSLLAPLAALAEKYNVAVVCVRHLNKGTSKAAYRGMGSVDFFASVRSVFLCGPDPENGKVKVFCHVKSNLGPLMPALNYSIEDGQFRWGGESSATADEILSASATNEKSRKDEAGEFLKEALANGPVLSAKLLKLAEDRGIAARSLWRAKKTLSIKAKKEFGKKGAWLWEIPSK